MPTNKERMDQLEEVFAMMIKEQKETNALLRRHTLVTEESFARIDVRFGSIGERFQEVTEELRELNAYVARIDKRLQHQETEARTQIIDLQHRVSALENRKAA